MSFPMPPNNMPAPTLVLIAGYARTGKSTLASGILEWSQRPAEHINFADALKEAANHYMDYLGLDGDFFKEDFKVDNRDFLVHAGKFARRMDQDVFARHFANWVPVMKHHDQPSPETVVTSDWRYINELRVAQDILWEKGWKVRTIYVATADRGGHLVGRCQTGNFASTGGFPGFGLHVQCETCG